MKFEVSLQGNVVRCSMCTRLRSVDRQGWVDTTEAFDSGLVSVRQDAIYGVCDDFRAGAWRHRHVFDGANPCTPVEL